MNSGEGRRETDAAAHGLTLVELIVVLALLGIVLAMSGLALSSLRAPREAESVRDLRQARAQAIRTGLRVRARTNISHLPSPVFLPDGRAIGPGVDPLTGAPRAP